MIKTWDQLFEIETKKEYFQKLNNFIETEERLYQVFPPRAERFKCFELTPLNQVKVVLIGQDPYHGNNQACGLAFSLKIDQRPPTLLNIFKELQADLGYRIPKTNDLTPWAQSGVLLLNRILTVRANQPLSHQNQGWECFTNQVIKTLNAQKKPICFILWGKKAQELISLIDASHHLIISSNHPSPLSAYRGFFGSKPFSKTQDFLTQNHLNPVNWDLTNYTEE